MPGYLRALGGPHYAVAAMGLGLVAGALYAPAPTDATPSRPSRPEAPPAPLHHGVFNYDQVSADSGSCCVEVRAVSSCTSRCDAITAGIRKDGQLRTYGCMVGGDQCTSVKTPGFTYSYPVTVFTSHSYVAGAHQAARSMEVRYA
jgi:hypothetical protein